MVASSAGSRGGAEHERTCASLHQCPHLCLSPRNPNAETKEVPDE